MWANNINICSSINESEIFAFMLFTTACSGDKDGSKCILTGGHYLFEEGSKHWVQDQRYSAQVSETLSTSIGFSQDWGAHIHTVALPLRGDAERPRPGEVRGASHDELAEESRSVGNQLPSRTL